MKRIYMALAVLFTATVTFAQVSEAEILDNTPPQPSEYGKCYAKCKIPAKYETTTRQVLVSGGTTNTKTVPAKYETVTERVMVKEGSVKYKYIPAKYETVTQQVLAKEGSCKVVYTPAQYTTTTNKRLVKEAYGQWVRKPKAAGCVSENPEDCYVLCWEEVAAQYEYDVDQVLVSSESYDTVYADPVYKTIKVQRVVEPARTVQEEIPPVYKDITRKVLVQCEGVMTTTTPAKYKTVKDRVMVSPEGVTDWVEVVCNRDINLGMVSQVQQALNSRGYDAGSVDGVMGARTKAALIKFQTDNSLPTGNLNIATMKALGLK